AFERLAQANELIARRGKPQRLAFIGIDDDVRRRGAELLPGIEHPGVADAVDPGAVLHERRLMHVAAEHDVWLVFSDPLRKLGVAEIAGAAPADRRLVRRRVMDPDPLLARLPRSLGELGRDAVARDRPVPPRADGE